MAIGREPTGAYDAAFPITLPDGSTGYARAVVVVDGGTGAAGSSLPNGVDRSGSITTGGTAQDVAPANAARQGLTIQNTSDTPMRVTENGADATSATGYLLAAGAALNVSTNKRVSIFCATTGKSFAATEY